MFGWQPCCPERSSSASPRRRAQYDTIRDGVADIGWIVYGYTPGFGEIGKFETTKLAELPGNTGNATEMSVAFQMTHEKYLAAAKEAKGVNTWPTSCTARTGICEHHQADQLRGIGE